MVDRNPPPRQFRLIPDGLRVIGGRCIELLVPRHHSYSRNPSPYSPANNKVSERLWRASALRGYRVQARQFADSATRPIARRSFPLTSNAPRFSARVCLRRLSIAAPLVATAASSTGWRRESAAGLQPLLAGLLTAPDYSLMNIGNYVRGSLDGDSFSGQTMDGPPGAKRSARAGLRLPDPFPGRDLLRFRFRPLIRHSVG